MTGRVLPFDPSTHTAVDAFLPFYVNGTLEGDELVLSVTNRGPTLPERMRKQLFDSLVSIRERRDGRPHLEGGRLPPISLATEDKMRPVNTAAAAATLGTAGFPATRIDRTESINIGARIDRGVPQVLSSHARGPSPHELPSVWTTVGPNGPAHVVGHQVAEQAMQTPVLLEGLKDQADNAVGLLVGVQLRIAVGSPDISHGGMQQQCTASSLVTHPFQHPAFHEGEFRFAHHPTQPSQ